MDRRSWPWKKKSSDKTSAKEAAAILDLAGASVQEKQDNYKKPNYVQISVESYSHLTGLEEQVKTYEEQVQTLEDQIKDLNEKLSAAQSEMTTKDNLVKQHAKVAEEAVSGWEKAEAEALALKNHLESVTLSKLTAEDRASHLDGALKECMRQIRNLKEEHEQKLQDVILSKTKQCEKIKSDLQAKMVNFEQELLRSAAENAALSRSLQERSNMLIKISEEKSQAEAEIEHLKGNIESCEREINSFKYELHIVSKELEIRNEEKNMSMKSAEAANKQHMESVKKIAKLEAECQRLRGLVRKKLPGPAALAQMKQEVESLGRDYGETRLRRSPGKPGSPHMSPVSEFSLDNVQKFQKENEFLTERLLAMEEETKMLKEALAKRNSELQASRSMCAKTVSKLKVLETQLQASGEQKGSPNSIIQISHEGTVSQHASNPPSLTSLSEDGNDDNGSCAESWATALISELSQFRKEKNTEKSSRAGSASNLELMDDFLEMEKLACQSNNSNGEILLSVSSDNKTTNNNNASHEIAANKDVLPEKLRDPNPTPNQLSSDAGLNLPNPGSEAKRLPLIKLQSRISAIHDSIAKDADVGKYLDDIKHILDDANDILNQHCLSCTLQDVSSSDAACDRQANPEDAGLTAEDEITSSHPVAEAVQSLTQDLEFAITQIHSFILLVGKEAMAVHDIASNEDGMSQKIEEFSLTFNKVLQNNASLVQFILDLSPVLDKAIKFRFNVLGYKGTESESNSPHCIDKVALPENKLVQEDLSGERYSNGCSHIPNHSSDPEIPDDGNLVSDYKSNSISCKITMEEFEELKLEKEKIELDLARCSEGLQMGKCQLQDTEQLLAEAKAELASVQRSNSLAETQLKCMAESYRALEARSAELETELNSLRVKTVALENELEDEKRGHQDALEKCKELEEQLRRNESTAVDDDLKSKQERDLAAAAEKLAECQETIFLLGKQLNALRPQSDQIASPFTERSLKGEGFNEEEPTTSGIIAQDLDRAEMDDASSAGVTRMGAESPLGLYNSPSSPSEIEANHSAKSPVRHPRHRPTKSASSSASSTPTPEKHARGFSRFFSSKGKNGH